VAAGSGHRTSWRPAKTAGIVARQVAHGQTNFARMIWKFGQVYNADRQFADHKQEVRYRLPEPARQPTLIASHPSPGDDPQVEHPSYRRETLFAGGNAAALLR
jgi:hypothetical protein